MAKGCHFVPAMAALLLLGCQSSSTTLIDRRLDSSRGLAHHLDAHRRIAAVGQPRSQGRVTRPDFEPKVHGFGEPTGTAIDGSRTAMAGPMLVINGGSKTV
jgi:hypothetical protein